MSKKNLAGVAVFAVLIIFLAVYIYNDITNKDLSEMADDSEVANNLDIVDGGEVSAKLDESGLVSVKNDSKDNTYGDGNFLKKPNLDKEVVNLSNIDETSFNVIKKAISDKVRDIKINPDDESLWLTLATLRKMVGDYVSSVEILSYVSIRWPQDYIPLFNLADLYQFYIKDFDLAEKYLLKVIKMAPGHTGSYENLYLLYNSGYKGKQLEALKVLISGLEQNPKSTDLMINIARHYSSFGDIASSTAYYNRAIDLARFLGNKDLEQLFISELSSLKK